MSYAVVTFTKDDIEGQDCCTSEIPISWLHQNNTKCWWPSYSKNVGPLIAKSVAPNPEKWTVEDVIVELSGVSLEKARKFAQNKDYVSSDDTNKGRGKRKIMIASKYSSDDDLSSSSKSKEWRQITNIPLPPPLESTESSLSAETSPIMAQEAPPLPLSMENLPIVFIEDQNLFIEHIGEEAEGSTHSVDSMTAAVRTQHEAAILPDVNKKIITTESIQELTSILTKHHEQVTRMFVTINIALKNIDKRLSHLETGREKIIDNEGLEVIKQSLPFSNLEAISAFDNVLSSNPEIAKQFKNYVAGIGGNTPKDTIGRILKRIFTNACAMQCSWMGRKNNFPVHDLQCVALIKDAICIVFALKESEFESICSEWFRFAKQRHQREK